LFLSQISSYSSFSPIYYPPFTISSPHHPIETSLERDNDLDFEEDTLSDRSRERNLQHIDKGKGKVLGEKLDDNVEREF